MLSEIESVGWWVEVKVVLVSHCLANGWKVDEDGIISRMRCGWWWEPVLNPEEWKSGWVYQKKQVLVNGTLLLRLLSWWCVDHWITCTTLTLSFLLFPTIHSFHNLVVVGMDEDGDWSERGAASSYLFLDVWWLFWCCWILDCCWKEEKKLNCCTWCR